MMCKGSCEDLQRHSAEAFTLDFVVAKNLGTDSVYQEVLAQVACLFEFSADNRHVLFLQLDTLCKRYKHSFFFFLMYVHKTVFVDMPIVTLPTHRRALHEKCRAFKREIMQNKERKGREAR